MNGLALRRLRYVADIRVSNVDKKSVDGQRQVLLCNYTDVYYNDFITSGLPFMAATATDDQIAQFQIRRGDTLITKDSETPDDIGIPAFVAEDLPGVLCGYHLAIVRPRHKVLHPRFLFWVLASSWSRARLGSEANGITRFGLRTESFLNAPVPLPPLPVQRAIADYLDAETARIDALIARIGGDKTSPPRSLTGLLLEKRQALITAAVTGELAVPEAVV